MNVMKGRKPGKASCFSFGQISGKEFAVPDIDEKIAKTEEEIRQLQNKKKKLLNEKKASERKARTRRLIERGAILESLIEQPEQYDNGQIKSLLETALRTPQAQEYLRQYGTGGCSSDIPLS